METTSIPLARVSRSGANASQRNPPPRQRPAPLLSFGSGEGGGGASLRMARRGILPGSVP